MSSLFAPVLILFLGIVGTAQAASLAVNVTGQDDAPLPDAVATLTPLDGQSVQPVQGTPGDMTQHDDTFVPYVLPVAKGAEVAFLNEDPHRHHVYSFSRPKRFELKLFGGDETRSVTFDTSGVVAMGCNIHDEMIAYVYVTDAPLFSKSRSEGDVTFTNLPAGRYELSVWHPLLRGAPPIQIVTMPTAASETETSISLPLKPDPRSTQRTRSFDEAPY